MRTTHLRRRLVGAAVLASAGALAVQAIAATPDTVTRRGVDGVKLGAKWRVLHERDLVARKRPGCELDGPKARSARLRIRARGFVNLTKSRPRRVDNIQLRSGAQAKGVGFGDTRADIEAAFPNAEFIDGAEEQFGITIAQIPESDGGPFQFGIDTTSKAITLMGVPFLSFCE